MKEYFRKEYVKPVIHFLIRILKIVGVILLLDTYGLWVFLSLRGEWDLLNFISLLKIFLLVEGSLIGAVGAFMFFGYSEMGIFRQAAINPIIARDQRDRWKETRLSQQKWGLAMLIAGVMLVLLFLLIGFSISL